MELGFFLHGSFPLRTEDELLEETFVLLYVTEGAFTYNDLWGEPMSRKHRDWFLHRLSRQKKEERVRHDEQVLAAKNKRR